jgi:hypothetical protein
MATDEELLVIAEPDFAWVAEERHNFDPTELQPTGHPSSQRTSTGGIEASNFRGRGSAADTVNLDGMWGAETRVRVLSGGFLPGYAARLYWLIRPLRTS